VVWERTIEGAFNDKSRAIDIFTRHNEEVRRRVPSDRLLVFEPGQGWEPLCDFLGLPVPSTPFPRLNQRAVFNDPSAFARLVRHTVRSYPG